jgi:hypothetical protein
MLEEETQTPARRLRLKRWQIIALIVLAGALIRVWAAWQLPVDADEPTYLNAGRDYANFIKAGDLQGIIDYSANQEHPPLVKLMDSLPYLFLQPVFGSKTELYADRMVSVVWGTLGVFVLALINPLAGLLMALDSMVIKYTSEVYLEALPLFMILFSVYAFRRSFNRPGLNRWFWIAALAAGIAVGSKYLYALAGFPILAIFATQKKYKMKHAGLFFLAALVTFFAVDPHLWADPLYRLANSLLFHAKYTQGTDVLTANYPWYQVLVWITAMVPWHPQVFFFPTPDVVIFILALVGVLPTLRKDPWVIIWIFTSFITLLLWPTKWPQYTLVLIPALCLAASAGAGWIARKSQEFESTWHWAELMLPQPGKAFWIALFLFGGTIVSVKVAVEVERAEARAAWVEIRSEYSPLISNKVNVISIAKNGQMVLGTDAGLSFWTYSSQSPWGDSPTNFTPVNSGLANSQVKTLLQTSDSGWWIGTQKGLSYYDRSSGWKTYLGQDMGLTSDQINTLAEDSQGRIWVGTNGGAAVLEDGHWKTYTRQNSGLKDNAVFAIAFQPTNSVWFGHLKGVNRLDLQTNSWDYYDLSVYGFGWGGTVDLLVDRQNRLWAGTIGSGLNMWDGKEWTGFRVSNSGLPQNNVDRILEAPDGTLWVGCSFPAEPGGVLASFDGETWKTFDASMSGYSGAEALSLAMDANNRLWIGTTVSGIDILQTKQ